MAGKTPIEVGGPYVENDSHVPNPTDIISQFNTSGLGAHGKIEETAAIFEVDKVAVAQEILGALDPKDNTVSSDRVLLPNTDVDNETARKDLKAVAEARVEQGVVIGGPTPAQREAEKEGDEGAVAASQSLPGGTVKTESGTEAEKTTGTAAPSAKTEEKSSAAKPADTKADAKK